MARQRYKRGVGQVARQTPPRRGRKGVGGVEAAMLQLSGCHALSFPNGLVLLELGSQFRQWPRHFFRGPSSVDTDSQACCAAYPERVVA